MARHGTLSDPAAQGRMRAHLRATQEQRRSDVAVIMALPEGRRFMYDLIFDKGGLMNIYLSSDSGIYRQEGRRAIAGEISAELQRGHPEQYILMLTERMAAQETERSIRDDITAPKGDDDAP